jgi:hypothetical protein
MDDQTFPEKYEPHAGAMQAIEYAAEIYSLTCLGEGSLRVHAARAGVDLNVHPDDALQHAIVALLHAADRRGLIFEEVLERAEAQYAEQIPFTSRQESRS